MNYRMVLDYGGIWRELVGYHGNFNWNAGLGESREVFGYHIYT